MSATLLNATQTCGPFECTPQMQSILSTYIASPFLSWSLTPIVASFLGFISACMILEWVNAQSWAVKYHITYGGQPRPEALLITQSKVSWWEQFKRTLMFVGGPFTMIGFTMNSFIFPLVIPQTEVLMPSLSQFAVEFALLMLTADFFLYWAHRAAHEIPFLWEGHKVHHMIGTPSAVGTAFISTMDAFVHAGPPMTLCALVVRPHPASYAVYIAWHLANAAHNHSGLDCWFLNILAGKVLPLRSGNAHHDGHHRFANYGPNATNYGDTFIFWDKMFGSMEAQQPDPTGTVCKATKAE